tara:strand:- start:76 stop:372 length:297 start_codon:yes stop_codon:yes gene_type:complete
MIPGMKWMRLLRMLEAEAETERIRAVSNEIATAVWARPAFSDSGQFKLPMKIKKGTVRVPPPIPKAPDINEIRVATMRSIQNSLASITNQSIIPLTLE